jgi:DNA invertase Pin-like site-specific DNA recombinase
MLECKPLQLLEQAVDIMAQKKPALAYLRTSSSTNVGEDKDSDKRQLVAIESYAKRAGYEIVAPAYYDAAVRGADTIAGRPGFAQLLERLRERPDIKTILVETASRFARDLIVQETGYRMLRDMDIDLVPVDSPHHFTEVTPTANLIRQILGAVAEFEKAMLVSRLRGARERKRAVTGKCGGRKSHLEAHPQTVGIAKSLRWINKRMREKRSYRDIAAELAKQGHLSASGKPYGTSAIKSMLEG